MSVNLRKQSTTLSQDNQIMREQLSKVLFLFLFLQLSFPPSLPSLPSIMTMCVYVCPLSSTNCRNAVYECSSCFSEIFVDPRRVTSITALIDTVVLTNLFCLLPAQPFSHSLTLFLFLKHRCLLSRLTHPLTCFYSTRLQQSHEIFLTF